MTDDLTCVNVTQNVLVEFIERVAVAGGSDIKVSHGDRGWYVTYIPPFTRDIKEDCALIIEEAECTSCIYTDSPCVCGDYPMKDGRCTHYKHFGDEIAALKAQIEKMKNYQNCDYRLHIADCPIFKSRGHISCKKCPHWILQEIKEND